MDVADIPGAPEWLPDHLRGQGIEELYPPQAEAVAAGVTEGESLVASIPTASGKTLIAAMAMLSSIERGGKALYIVPLRALASEKQADFAEYEQYGLDVGVSTGNYESEGGWLADKDIVVATSEKVDSLVRNDAPWLDDLSCVVADEVHLVDDSERGPTLEVTLAKLRSLNEALQTVALSATIGNAGELADWLDAGLVDSDWRPIDLQKGVHYGDALHLEDGSQSRVAVKNSEDQTAAVVRDTLEDDGSSLVFVNSRRNAEAAARRLTGTTEGFLSGEEREHLAEIAAEIRDVSDTETSDDLADAVESGAAFHHAGLCVTAETQILRPDGTFNDVATLVEGRPDEVVGLSDYDITPVNVTDTFEMGTRPVLKVRTRTGNTIRLSENHPLPVLRESGLEWVRAENLSPGEYVARPRQLDFDIKTSSFRSLVPDTHRVFREYDTVNRLTSQLEDPDTLPHSHYQRHKWDRNITVGDFRRLCEANGEDAPLLYDSVICDGGQQPIRIPEAVNENICWLSGVVAGDGYLRENSVVLTGSSELLSEYHRIVVEEFEREPVAGESSSSGTPYLSLGSTVVADIFAEHFGMSRGEGTDPRLPDIALESNLLGAYVSGLFDADGSVSPRENSDGAPRVEFYSTSDTLITQLKTALLRFGIVAFRDRREVEGRVTEHDGRTIRSRQDVLRLTIYGTEQLRRFEEHIGFRHSDKSEKLRTAIDTNPNSNRRQNDVIPSEIGRRVRRRRNERGLSMSDLEPEIPKATLSRFENRKTPMKRTTFERLAEKLDDTLLCSLADAEVFWDRIEAIDEDGEEQLYDLSTESGNFVANGVIAHNTSDHRSLVEDAFRERLLKVVSATPTLAAGVNTPSRRVVVRDWRRYDGTAGGMQPLSVLEVHQMMGRAGRPGLDPYGEAVLVASSHDELDELFERYVWADPEPVQSKLAAEPALRTHILATVASGFARSRAGLLDFLDGTLYAAQTADPARLETVTDNVITYLERNGFLTRDGEELSATNLGHTVSRLYLDPMSAAEIIDGLRAAQETGATARGDETDADETEEPAGFQSASDLRDSQAETTDEPPELTALGLYHLVARTPDMYELYLRSGDEETYTEIAYERENELLGRAPSEYEDRFEDWLSALKTARLLEDWASELDEDRITDRYGVGPGDIRGKVDTAQWLLGAAESLVSELDMDVAPAIREARIRAEHGVRSELVDLAGVRGVGRKRARRLFDAGIESPADLREADKSVVLAALRGRRKTAENVLENAGHRDPSMDDVEPSDDVSYEGTETSPAADDGDAADDQANLGDF